MKEKPPIFRGVINQFPRAIEAIAMVSLFGADKYNNGDIRFDHKKSPYHKDCGERHLIAIAKGEDYDKESGEPHLAHRAWRTLADLELWLLEKELENYEKIKSLREGLESEEPIGSDCMCELGSTKHYHPNCEYTK